ncbi:hypothetical protein GLOIN_2v1791047 [Rhizophagus clarus]|uniref:Uncharacterized protein n=1 Tax=Rhizophagus clarus TaxID=94130 RepID=A0A8H3KZ30_9GLOM|nr:hypothetical protein GLOIN_2v1791047 [Rhizophagus clarus]
MNLSKVLFLIALITLNVLLVSVSSAPMRLEKRPKGPIPTNKSFFCYENIYIYFNTNCISREPIIKTVHSKYVINEAQNAQEASCKLMMARDYLKIVSVPSKSLLNS